MAIYRILGKNVVWFDEESNNKYWLQLSKHIKTIHPKINNKDPNEVVKIFKECFNYLISLFEKEIQDEKDISFFSYVYGMHENSIEIYLMQLNGEELNNFKKADFALYRRILKLILEQAPKMSLTVGKDLRTDVVRNKERYQEKLQDLIFLGVWIYGISEYVARMDIMGPVHGIQFEEDETLSFLTWYPFQNIIEAIEADYYTHTHKVVVDINGINELNSAIQKYLGVDPSIALGILGRQFKEPQLRFGLIPIEVLKKEIISNHGVREEDLDQYYAGISLNLNNALPISQSVLNPQDQNRYIYRPLLDLNTNIGNVALISVDKFSESNITLTTNAIPWGIAPQEWLDNEGFKQFVEQKNANHDKLLENEVQYLIEAVGIPFVRNIKSFRQLSGDYISCDIKGVGEMDFLFIHPEQKTLYIVECKHNRSRYDMVSWRKEYSNFTIGYEQRLQAKVNWVDENKEAVDQHFKQLHKESDILKFSIVGIFIINAPNFYLYNGNLPCYTLNTFEQLLNNTYSPITFEIIINRHGRKDITVPVDRPYFTNALKLIPNK